MSSMTLLNYHRILEEDLSVDKERDVKYVSSITATSFKKKKFLNNRKKYNVN